jgi:flagellar hook-associated protein 3 FlgL
MRITTSMVQRHVLSDLNGVSARLRESQMKIASNREISRPSDDPFNASRAMALRQELDGTRQHQRNAKDALGWQEATEQALAQIGTALHRARDLVVQGASDAADPVARASIASEIDQLVESIKQNANATYGGNHLFSGTELATAPYLIPPYAAAVTNPDAYQGDEAGLDPAIPGVVREIGPGVTMTINVVGRELLGDGPAANDGGLLDVMRGIAGHLRSGDGAALRGSDLERLDARLDVLLELRAGNGARMNRLDSALGRLAQVEESTLLALSETEDADIAKTIIEFNSQQSAYQAALKAGASIAQGSLMDFLR